MSAGDSHIRCENVSETNAQQCSAHPGMLSLHDKPVADLFLHQVVGVCSGCMERQVVLESISWCKPIVSRDTICGIPTMSLFVPKTLNSPAFWWKAADICPIIIVTQGF